MCKSTTKGDGIKKISVFRREKGFIQRCWNNIILFRSIIDYRNGVRFVENKKVEFIYKEKVRLTEVANTYAQSSFNDFKMLSALGALLTAFKPILESVGAKANDPTTLLIGFLAINITITLVGMFNLLKQPAINFYFDEIQILEEEIYDKLKDANSKSFQTVKHWKAKGRDTQKKVVTLFFGLISFVALVFPTAILYFSCKSYYSLIYAFFAVLLITLHRYALYITYDEGITNLTTFFRHLFSRQVKMK